MEVRGALRLGFVLLVAAAVWLTAGTAVRAQSDERLVEDTPKVIASLTDDPWASDQATVNVVKSYLDRMELYHKADIQPDRVVIDLPVELDNATHHVLIVPSAGTRMLYIALNRYLTVPEDHPNLLSIMKTLMHHNWDLNVGKFEWDPRDGEVRLSYSFSTENGVGFEAFEAVLVTLCQVGDDLLPPLQELVDVSEEAAGVEL
jgi:hypothetical protein